jgi:hypothetical protein
MTWETPLPGASLTWLLESADPGVRYLALRDLVDSVSAEELSEARRAAHTQGPLCARSVC